MSNPVIYGFSFSPFVRKVLVVAREKNINHEQVSISPASKTILNMNPVGKIPVMAHGDLTLPDSTVIAAYFEKIEPEPKLYPADPAEYGKALWFQVYADTFMFQSLGVPTVYETYFGCVKENREVDQSRIDKVIDVSLPPICEYLEGELGDNQYLVGETLTIADIAVAGIFQYIKAVCISVNDSRFPVLADYLLRILSRESFAQSEVAEIEEIKAVHQKYKEKMAAAKTS